MRGTEVTLKLVFVIEECCNCGVAFAIPDTLQAQLLRSHRSFYCPNGHSQSYTGESKEERLARELEASRLELKRAEYRAQSERIGRERVQGELSTTKEELTRTKKRTANGVCPECRRTFQNLARHMHCKHPEYAEVS